jgi:UDPglucose--hexose-1-phosphate uridylyltransferase
MSKNKKSKFPSELRFDLVSEDWVVIAARRGRRPKKSRIKCPFCNLKEQKKPVLVFPNTIVIPNKYPSFSPGQSLNIRREGKLCQRMNAVGFHELVITRDHNKHLANLSLEEIKEVIDVYQARYLELMKKKFVNHISIFHNYGRAAGASVAHPHSQIITTPLIDIDLKKALANSLEYQKNHKRCAYCLMNDWERRVGKRVIFENKEFLAICPFASKTAFEIIVSPKKHLSYFEKINEKQKWQLAEALKISFFALYKALDNPPYNFYLHTAPCDQKANYDFYHWHFTILPKIAIPAGFEIGTQMEISTIEPEKAARILRKNIK